MIERYVFVRLHDDHKNPEGRERLAAAAREALSGMDHVLSLKVGVPADAHAEKGWDLSLAARFQTLEEVAAYIEHPTHRAFVDQVLAPHVKVIKAWNFTTRE